jgi:hypothetical protein
MAVTTQISRPITRRLPRARGRKVALVSALAGGAIGLSLLAPVVFGSEQPDGERHRRPPLRPPDSLSVSSECSGFTSATSTVQWKPVGEGAVAGYVVDRSTEGGPYESVGSLNDRAAVRFVDSSLDTGTTYHYRLRSTAGSRRSDPSQAVEIGTPVLCLW